MSYNGKIILIISIIWKFCSIQKMHEHSFVAFFVSSKSRPYGIMPIQYFIILSSYITLYLFNILQMAYTNMIQISLFI